MGKISIILLCCLFGHHNTFHTDKQNANCDIIVNAGDDIVLCNGEMGQLNANIQGDYSEFEWIPQTGLSDPTLLNPIVDISVQTEYVLKALGEGDNMVVNGHFETGSILPSTTTFSWRDPKNFPNGVIKHYSIGNSSDIVLIPGCKGHTGPKMMVTNGPGADVWCQQINVKPNTDYKLELWVGGVKIFLVANSSEVDVKINGTKLGSVKGSKYCDWNLFESIWNSGSNTSAKICLDTDGGKRSYAIIDDISFKECCVITDTITVKVEEIIAQIEDPEFITCINHPLILNATASSQGSGYIYKWTSLNGLILSGSNTLTPIVDRAGIYTLVVVGVDGCIDSVDVEVVAKLDPPNINLSSLDLNCARQSVQIIVDSLFLDKLRFEWSGPNGFSSMDGNPFVRDSGWYEVLVKGEGGCKTTKRIHIDLDDEQPLVSWDYDTITCLNTSVDFIAKGGSASYNYQWSGPQGFTSLDQNIVASTAGIYEVVVTGANGCEQYIKLRLEEDVEKPTILLMNDTLDCISGSTKLEFLTDALNFSVNWSGPNGFQSEDIILNISQAGEYTLTIIDHDNGCQNEHITTVFEHPAIESFLTTSTSRCDMDSAILIIDKVIGGTPPYLYSADAKPLQLNTEFLVFPGLVEVIIEDANHCTYIEKIQVLRLDEIEGNLVDEISLQKGQYYTIPTTTNRAKNELASIEWQPKAGLSCADCLNPKLLVSKDANYTVKIVDIYGCEIILKIRIKLLAPNNVFVPNSFTPNGDGINDKFSFFVPEGVVTSIEEFSIYTSWGERVFYLQKGQSNDQNSAWDGRYYNKEMLPGVYVYKAILIWPNGAQQNVHGSITLIR